MANNLRLSARFRARIAPKRVLTRASNADRVRQEIRTRRFNPPGRLLCFDGSAPVSFGPFAPRERGYGAGWFIKNEVRKGNGNGTFTIVNQRLGFYMRVHVENHHRVALEIPVEDSVDHAQALQAMITLLKQAPSSMPGKAELEGIVPEKK